MELRVQELETDAYWKVQEQLITINTRLDLFEDDVECHALEIQNGDQREYIEYRVKGSVSELGAWMLPISREGIEAAISYIFDNHPGVKKIQWIRGLHKIGVAKQNNHFRIYLPETTEEFAQRRSAKHRRNMRRYRRLLEEEVGEVSFEEYQAADVPQDLLDAFYREKFEKYGRVYEFDAKEYLKAYHVTNFYAMRVKGNVAATAMTCEQCEVPFADNIGYESAYAKYECGTMIYEYLLNRMIEKGKKEIHLGGGAYTYKKHYGSVEEVCYDCAVYRSKLVYGVMKLRRWVFDLAKKELHFFK